MAIRRAAKQLIKLFDARYDGDCDRCGRFWSPTWADQIGYIGDELCCEDCVIEENERREHGD